MSAGDVQFVGWTGGDPLYKELAPQIQIEPAGDGLISKRVTINRICFDKDKAAVIGNLPTGNAPLSSVYIDTDGSVKTQGLGGGYTFLSVSDASVAKGFSRVSAQYAKTTTGVFEIGLPNGFSIDQVAGVCRIKYLTHVLEEFDSGTGVNGSGLEFKIIKNLPTGPDVTRPVYTRYGALAYIPLDYFFTPAGKDFQTRLYASVFTYSQDLNANLERWNENNVAIKYAILCNNVDFESQELFMKDMPGTIASATANTVPYAAFLTLQEAQETGDLYVQNGVATDYSVQSETGYYNDSGWQLAVNEEGAIQVYNLVLKNTINYLVRSSVNESLLYPRWESSGNTHKILIANRIIREYDVTGLT